MNSNSWQFVTALPTELVVRRSTIHCVEILIPERVAIADSNAARSAIAMGRAELARGLLDPAESHFEAGPV